MSSNWVGKTLGKVQIESLLARGGVAEVYLGTHTSLQRKVAVKILRNPSEEHSDALDRFQREARVVANLRHPNIVQVFDFDMADNDPYLVMEYIQGPSLSKYLHTLHQNDERLELPHVARLIFGVASALQYAHNNGIIHRDIKPGNILLISPTTQIEAGKPLPDDFEPVLTDFGLVRFLDSSRQTTTGVTAGTPAYMSPEQARGETTDGRTDVYSLGIVLYELLSGHLPFDGETTMSILLKHVNEPPAPIPGLSPFMQKVLDRALAKDVNDRFQTPLEFAKAFGAAVDINPATMQMESLASLGPSTIDTDSILSGGASARKKQTPLARWIRPAVAGVTVVAIGTFVFLNSNGSPFAAARTETMTIPPVTETSTRTQTPTPAIILGRTGVLHFQNGTAMADQASLIADAMLVPPDGYHYEVWLVNETERISLGILSLNDIGQGELTFKEGQGINLVSLYDTVEVTLEPNPDEDPQTTGNVVYAFTLPEEGLVNVRHLLSAYPDTPDESPLIKGLYANIKMIEEFAKEMQKASDNGNQARALQNAEAILNVISGDQSPNNKDWNNDGEVADPSDGYGLLLNGSHLGYLQTVFTEADAAVNSPGATTQMVEYGEGLKVSMQNLAQWTPQLRDLILEILNSPAGSDVKQQIVDSVALADRMLNGIDLDGDGKIEIQPGESGAQLAFDQAFHMADMPLSPVGIQNIGTGTPTFISVTSASSSGGGGGGGGGGNVAPTPKPGSTPPGQVKTDKPPPPGQDNKPPKPPKKDNNK
ncbi:MAG: hypothetical protein C3F07_13270 [Anaerolineales bacterium]|nr:hypothetical protein [Anaerolineae bacterium]PWB71725.1 MAG: hypothetical protein C3F07_13270 [Anaerolineales bacterium]